MKYEAKYFYDIRREMSCVVNSIKLRKNFKNILRIITFARKDTLIKFIREIYAIFFIGHTKT